MNVGNSGGVEISASVASLRQLLHSDVLLVSSLTLKYNPVGADSSEFQLNANCPEYTPLGPVTVTPPKYAPGKSVLE